MKYQLDTPMLCIDLDALDNNIEILSTACQRKNVGWRPHAKCHKSTNVARRLLRAGAIGLTCAKLGEAEVFAAAGIADILIANMLVGARKIERLVALRSTIDPIVCVDHIEQARPIAAAMHAARSSVRVLIEVDIGMRRVGLAPGAPVVQLARELTTLPGISFSGVMGYEGHLLQIADADEKRSAIHHSLDGLGESKALLERASISCPIVSCGGTGSWQFALDHPDVTEIQAGGGIFMDEFYRERCHVQGGLQQSLTVVATVVSRPAPDRAVIDAGRKTLNQELQAARVLRPAGCTIAYLSAEHGVLNLSDQTQTLAIGDRVELIPGYNDFTTVLHDQFYVFRGEELVNVWPLEARGKLQ
jgi:D-serine deaminase-like pyridoxal phosphate-dependent protein